MYDYPLGDWDAALTNCKQAASIYWSIGNLRSWGGATCCAWNVLRAKGDPEWVVLSRDLVRVASETHDQQLRGWAGACAGVERSHHGLYEAAILELEKAATLLELVPDYLILAWALAHMAS